MSLLSSSWMTINLSIPRTSIRLLAFLLEKIPACMHLVIATRSDPPISLARLRGQRSAG